MYGNTGKGGLILNNIHDVFPFEIRRVPSTKDDFLKNGLTEKVFFDYINYIKRLYGEYFVLNNQVAIKYSRICNEFAELNSLWSEFTDFCIDNNLILEYADSSGRRMLTSFPYELEHFKFIYFFPEFPDDVYVCTLDEFRLAVERILTNNIDDWYLVNQYGVSVYTEGEKSTLVDYCYDFDYNNYTPLSQNEIDELLFVIEKDINEIAHKISDHCNTLSPELHKEDSSVGCVNQIAIRKKWLDKRVELEKEYLLIKWCLDTVLEIVETSSYEKEYISFPDDTLYIHKGRIICTKQHHNVEHATAVLLNKNEENIQLNVCHCIDCKKFFLDYNTYQRYREKYGAIIGNIRMTKNEDFSDNCYELADESPLRLCGYSVSQKNGLSQNERQTIIEGCIRSGAMDKEGVIRLLNWFIEVNGAKKGNEIAYRKWCQDLDFVLHFNIDEQNHYNITKIKRYSKNRFYFGLPKPNLQTSSTSKNPLVPYVGKRVIHTNNALGKGTVIDENEKHVVISFDNGKNAKFLRDAFKKGLLTII